MFVNWFTLAAALGVGVAPGHAAALRNEHAAGTMRVRSLKTLCVIYRGDPAAADHMDDHAVEMARSGAELGRLFYFRNSGARLNCELDWLVIDEAPPPTEGPTMDHIEADLRKRGVKPGAYDGLFVTGIGLAGNWGGFTVLDGTAGCFGGHGDRAGLTWYPQDDPDTAHGTAWNFAHEYQHAIDLVVAQSAGHTDLLHAHPYTDRNEPFFRGFYQGGEHWDWIACTFREFDAWLDLKGVTDTMLECADADGDGMPDDDERLPMDEKRFGSDPAKKDTDGDGLDDLAEFAADRYAGSDPNKPDTDGDGRSDGEDRYPVIPIAPEVPYRTAGTTPEWEALIEGAFVRNDEGGVVGAAVAWNEGALYFRFAAKRRFTVHAKIDGSADNGFWEGGDTYLLRFSAEGLTFDGLGMSGPVPGASVSAYSDRKAGVWYLEASLPAELGQGVSKEINYGGKRDAADTVSGLTLTAGRSVGFNFIFEFENGQRAVLTPHHTMYATTLTKPADATELVVLRAPRATADATPTVEVLAVRPGSLVTVTADRRIVGARFGPGKVHLTGLDENGSVTLTAAAGDVTSDVVTLLIDRAAAPPVMRREGEALIAECEPGASFELWWGVEGVPVAPLAGRTADREGRVSLPLSESLLAAWRVAAFEGSRFEKQVYVEAWPTIDRNFQGGRPDERLGGDDFSMTFDAYLMVETAGVYRFELDSDDGSRLYVNGELLINNWGHHGMTPRSASVKLDPGPNRLHVDYYELDGWAGVRLRYAPPGGEWTTELPVRSVPRALGGIELFGVQTDALGNRSAFASVRE
jgi:hypothetical protein